MDEDLTTVEPGKDFKVNSELQRKELTPNPADEALKRSIVFANEQLATPHTPEEIQARSVVLVPIDEAELQSGAAFTDIANSLFSDVYEEDYKVDLAGRCQERVLGVRDEMAREKGVDPATLRVNKVTLMNAMSVVERDDTPVDSRLTHYDSWDGRVDFKDVHEDAHFELSIVEKPEGIRPDYLQKSIAEFSSSGSPYGKNVENARKLYDLEWYLCRVTTEDGRTVNIYFPRGSFGDYDSLKRMTGGIAGVNRGIEKLIGPKGETQDEAYYFVLPKKEFIPNVGGFAEREKTVVDATQATWGEIVAHEKTHTELFQRYGTNHVGLLTEGAAVYFANQEFPGGPVNLPERQYRMKDVIATVTEEATQDNIPLTHRELSELPGLRDNTQIIHRFTYTYGYLFTDFFVKTYGKDKYLELYKLTSTSTENLTDRRTSKQVVDKGKTNGTEAEILEAAISSLDIDVGEFKKKLSSHIATQSQGPTAQ